MGAIVSKEIFLQKKQYVRLLQKLSQALFLCMEDVFLVWIKLDCDFEKLMGKLVKAWIRILMCEYKKLKIYIKYNYI